VIPNQLITNILDDGRKASISFKGKGNKTHLKETFEAEDTHSIELQREGWQAILNNFKKYVESSSGFEKIHFEIAIDAGIKKVYTAMLDKKYYAAWTAIFNRASHFIGTWEKGKKIFFLGTNRDGKTGGMVSRIKENLPNRFVSIEHLGLVQDGKEITDGPEIKDWAGALENYTFSVAEGKTILSVDADASRKFRSYFEESWPKALDTLLFGRKTYEKMASYWPTPIAGQKDLILAGLMNQADKLVISGILKKADWNNTKVIRGDVVPEINRLKNLPGRDITLLGSGCILTLLSKHGLIDEYEIMVDPVALGAGIPIFHRIKHPLKLKLTRMESFQSGVVLLSYERQILI